MSLPCGLGLGHAEVDSCGERLGGGQFDGVEVQWDLSSLRSLQRLVVEPERLVSRQGERLHYAAASDPFEGLRLCYQVTAAAQPDPGTTESQPVTQQCEGDQERASRQCGLCRQITKPNPTDCGETQRGETSRLGDGHTAVSGIRGDVPVPDLAQLGFGAFGRSRRVRPLITLAVS